MTEINVMGLPISHKCFSCKEQKEFKVNSSRPAKNDKTIIVGGLCPDCGKGMSKVVSLAKLQQENSTNQQEENLS